MEENDKHRIFKSICKIKEHCKPYGARILAAVKTRTPEEIDYITHICGINLIGENRVQELLSHFDAIDRNGVEIHFIGTLQNNKIKYLPGKVDVIESLSTVSSADEIQRRFDKFGNSVGVYIEVNIGREKNKSGIMPEELESFAEYVMKLPRLRLEGLMTMAPICRDEDYKEYFSHLSQLRDIVLKKVVRDGRMLELSMGMSNSYVFALENGATIIRPGTAIFGERKKT